MKAYHAPKIRNVAVIGHGGEGKTTLCEAMLFTSGIIDRMGSVDDGNTVTDYDQEEVKRTISISTALAPMEWNGHKINAIDTPGYFDFEGEVVQALSIADSALIVVGAVSGLSVGTEKAWKMCDRKNKPRAIVVNRMDAENANFRDVLDQLIDEYGHAIAPVQLPMFENDKFVGYINIIDETAYKYEGNKKTKIDIPAERAAVVADYRNKLVEAAAENDEELIEKFFEDIPVDDRRNT